MTRPRPDTAPVLPPVAPEVLAAAVESLTTRLRGRLDAAVEALAANPVDTADDGTYGVHCAVDARVTLAPGPSGTITAPDQARCTCLLSPRCLHRTAVLAAAPVAEAAPPAPGEPATVGEPATAPAPSAATAPSTVPAPSAAPAPSAGQTRAAADLWTAGAAVLAAGVPAVGAVLRAELLRAAHTARLAGLYRAEGAALDVVRRVREAHDPDSPNNPRGTGELTAALRELLLVAHRLKAADADPALIGAVRHHHRPDRPLRLYGVCREPVVEPGGRGGVVTRLVGDDGRWYALRDVGPGGAGRARRAGTAPVALRSFLSDHERLSRGGLVVTGAVVAPDGSLLAEPGVRAAFAPGRPWTDVVPATAAPAGPGQAAPPTVCAVEVLAADGEGVLVRALTGDAPGPVLRLAPAHRHPALAHTANLGRLGACPGLRVRVLGRVDPERATTLRPLAVGPVNGSGAPTLALPEQWRGRADLGYDRLRDEHLPFGATARPAASGLPGATPRPADPPLRHLRDLVELAVTGGRRAAAEPARTGDRDGRAAALRDGGFTTGADLYTALAAAAARRSRDVFGRPAGDDRDHYAARWLATAVYLTGTEAALGRALWQG
ncbi:hypothetical protein [Streptomyces sp. NRRL F-5650]|uniref:hypothetical protein n=1 Tax=Streptomyces sp. NRRL F-5650 TaxID=1463868 RepID=UPI0004C7730A|nr:hypothetical protein [Streptomyces sp. NRRL F-5650]